jgi:hypothetical protein
MLLMALKALSIAPSPLPVTNTAHGSHVTVSMAPLPFPATTTISITGPMIQSYTVINGLLPRQLLAQPKISVDALEDVCVFARIGLFHDMTFRKWLNTQTYMRLHVLEPRLLL